MNTRRYYRSTAEAFKDADYASSITAYQPDSATKVVLISCGCAFVGLILMACVGWLA